jgi:hypothetical protein
MVSTSTMRKAWADYRCLRESGQPTVRISLYGSYVGIAPVMTAPAWSAMEAALQANGYGNVTRMGIERRCPKGIGGRTCFPDGTNCSLHNYSIAIDWDWFAAGNPYFRKKYGDGWDFDDCKFTRAQAEAVERIKLLNGRQVWRWLGWAIGDTMHFELQVGPEELATIGIDPATVPDGYQPPPDTGDDWMYWGKKGDGMGDNPPDSGVAYWQKVINKLRVDPIAVDGKYGDDTMAAVSVLVPSSDGMQIDADEAAEIMILLGLLGPDADDPPWSIDELDHRYAPLKHGGDHEATTTIK